MSRNYQRTAEFTMDERRILLRKDGQPCKNKSKFVRIDGGCLRCDADHGEACRRQASLPETEAK